jgi:hypothetical protein
VARIRTIKPEFWTDEKIVELSFPARLLFVGLWNFADDDGRLVYSPKRLKMQIFPGDTVDVGPLFGELVKASLVELYQIAGVNYMTVKHFAKHQRIDRRTPSKIPAPTTRLVEDSASTRRTPTTEVEVEGNGVEGNGTDGNGSAARAVASKRSEPNEANVEQSSSDAQVDIDLCFEAERFIAKLREIWPRPDFGQSSEVAAMEALEEEMRDTALAQEDAADNLISRITHVAQIVRSWPRDELNKLPGLTTLLRTRRYRQDDVFWQRVDPKQARADERHARH